MAKFGRRAFLQMTGAALAAIETGALAAGCHEGSINPLRVRSRIHFNLSNFGGGERFQYHDFNGPAALERHTPDTILLAKDQAPELQPIPEASFTHYVDADLPAMLVSTAYLTRTVLVDGTAQQLLVHLLDHVPSPDPSQTLSATLQHVHPSSRAALRQRTARRLLDGHSHPSGGDDDGCTHVAGANDEFICADGSGAVSPGECLDQYVETVIALLKKHPSLVKLDPDVHLTMESLLTADSAQGGLYRDVVRLAVLLKGFEGCNGGWTELKKYKRYEDNLTDYLVDGAPVYGFHIKNDVMQQLAEPLSSFIDQCRNLTALKDVIWTHSTVVPDSSTALSTLSDSQKVDVACPAEEGVHMDIGFSGFGQRTLSIKFHNTRLRHLGIYYRYLDADEKPIALDELGTFPTKADQYYVYGDMLSSVLMVVDIWKFDTYKTILADWPEQASYVEVVLGGPGQGASSDYATKGIVWSAILEMAVPTALTIGGVVLGSKKAFIELMEDCEAKLAIGVVGGFLLAGKAGFDYGTSGGNGWTILADFANTLVPLLIDTGLSTIVAKYMGQSSVATACPMVRVLVQMGTIGLYLGQMGRTISDWVTSSKLSSRKLSVHYDAQVTVHHDPRDAGGFPKQAATYQLKRIYQNMNRVDRSPEVALGPPETWPQSIAHTFPAVPSGGLVKYVAELLSDNGTVVAQGQTDWRKNTEHDASTVTLVVMNNIVPLTHETTYHHAFVAIKETDYQWQKTSTAPPGTIDHLSTANHRISELGGLTLDHKNGLLGYDWKASGTGLQSCTSPADSLAQLHVFQTLNSFGAAGAPRIFPACAFTEPVMLAYDYLPALFLIKYWVTPSVVDKLRNDDSISLSQATLDALSKMAIAESSVVQLFDSATDPEGVCRGESVFVRALGAHLGTDPDKLLVAKLLDYAKKTWSLTDDNRPISDPNTVSLGNYLIDPRQAQGTQSPSYFVSALAAKKDTGYTLPPLGTTERVTYGKFIHRPTAVALTASKLLVAVNRELSVLEALDLKGVLHCYEDAPPAVIRAGRGTQEGAGTVLGPVAVAGTYDGNILVLESAGDFQRVQAFTSNFENAAIFKDGTGNATAYIYLGTEGAPTRFVDLAVESRGYIFLLGYVNAGSEVSDYRLVIYDPTGHLLCVTEGFNAGRIAVDMWRTVYALNYAQMAGSGIAEPSLSIWLPSM